MAQYLDSSGLKIIADELKTAFSQVENNASSKMWNIVANLAANEKVKANTSTGRIYLVGQDDASDGTIESTYKNASVYMQSGKMYATSGNINSSETALVTGAAVNTAINTALASALQYCGTLANDSNVSTAATKTGKKKGDVYVASAIFKPSKTYINNWKDSSVEVGDLFIFDGSKFDIVNGENQVEQISHTLAWDTDVSIAKIDGTTITVKLPSNPNSVTGITAGASGTVTNSSTTNPYIKIKDDSTHRSQIQLKGGGITSVSSDANGAITISTDIPGSADSANTLNAEYLTDLNNGTMGRLFFSAFQAANTPPGANYFAGLTFGSDSIKQLAMSYHGNLYTRYSNKTTWSNWKQLAFTSDIPTKLSQLTDDVVAGKYLPLSKFQVAEVANPSTVYLQSGIYRQSEGSHLAVGTTGWSQFITLHAGGDNWAQMYFSYNGMLHYRTATFGDGDPANIPWTEIITAKNIGIYNAGSATKLATPRKLWGNDFDGTADVDGTITIKNGANLILQSPSDAQTDSGDIVFAGFGGDELCRLYKDPHDSQMLMRFGETGTSYTMLHSGNIKDQYVAGVYDSYNPLMKITFNYAGDAVTSNPTWLACWNGYTLSYVSPDNVKAGSATKLKTPRKLWGNDFDGTADVNGLMYVGNEFHIEHPTTGRQLGISPYWTILGYNNPTIGNPTYIDGRDVYIRYGNDEYVSIFASNGNVGIGTTSPTEKLDVVGNIKASGFIKSGSSDSYVLLGGGGHKSLSDFSKASWTTFTPAETALTNDDVLSTTGEFSLAKGSWYYAGNGYLPAGEFGNIDLAGCSVLTFGGNSGGVYTQLFITSPAPMGTNAVKANEILFYNNHGEGYSPGWTRVLTNRNYTEYITDTNYYHTRSYSSGLQISTGTGVSNMYVPYATASQAGVVSAGDQTFAGIKTFNNELKMQGGGTYSTDIATGIACGFKVNRATINDAIIENIYLGAKNGATNSNMALNIKKYGSISSTAPANPTTLVSINESGHVTASAFYASAFYEDSDERLKTFGEDIKVDFDELVKLRKSHFVFNNNPTKQEIGVSAQEVKELYPEIVNTNEDGYLSVDYAKLSVIALKAVDILYNQNKDFERRLKEIEDKLK